jgi:urea transport system substrate-binding protein
MSNDTPMISRRGFGQLSLAAAAAAAAVTPALAAEKGEPIKIGILHSLSGTMAISETTLKDVMLMLIAEQNKKGGVLGRPLEAVVVDPASNWPLFAEKARELLSVDKVAAVFGCWTSVSRKSVLPVFEELNGILFYPVQYEGQECSRNVFYTGAAPNQQAIPAVDYLLSADGGSATRFVLAGTDYVYPRTTNQILQAYLGTKGIKPADIMVNYTPFGQSDWQGIVSQIKAFGSAGKKTAVVSTVNGDANVPFYKELGNQGIKSTDIPVMAFSVGEEELAGIDTKPLVGQLAAWNYFESIKTPANKAFIKQWHAFTKKPKRTTNDPMEAHYIGFNMWVQAVQKAGTIDHDTVIDTLIGIKQPNLTGGVATMLPNHHITKPVYIGEIQDNGQFNVVWKTPDLVPGKAWSPYVAETRNLIGDWRKPIDCGNYDTVAKRCVGTKHG